MSGRNLSLKEMETVFFKAMGAKRPPKVRKEPLSERDGNLFFLKQWEPRGPQKSGRNLSLKEMETHYSFHNLIKHCIIVRKEPLSERDGNQFQYPRSCSLSEWCQEGTSL